MIMLDKHPTTYYTCWPKLEWMQMLIKYCPQGGRMDASSDPIVGRTKRRASRGLGRRCPASLACHFMVQSIFCLSPSFLLLLLSEEFLHVGVLYCRRRFLESWSIEITFQSACSLPYIAPFFIHTRFRLRRSSPNFFDSSS
jgi:hypothetical protein